MPGAIMVFTPGGKTRWRRFSARCAARPIDGRVVMRIAEGQ